MVFKNNDNIEEIIVTGHSLGGSLATLCSKEVAKFSGQCDKKINLEVITFGASCVGDSVFASSIEDCLEKQYIQRFHRLTLGCVLSISESLVVQIHKLLKRFKPVILFLIYQLT